MFGHLHSRMSFISSWSPRPWVRLFGFCVLAITLECAPARVAEAQTSSTSTATDGQNAGCDVAPEIPSPPNTAKIFRRGGGRDDTADIQKAINELGSGDWLVFQPATYTITKHLTVPVSGVTLYGKGVEIHATSATDGALMIEGDDVAVYDFTLTQDSNSRQGTPWAGGISVFDNRLPARRRVQNVVIRGNTITNAAGVGIFLYKADNFTVADNTIYRSWADGIHMTAGSNNGRVINNSVSENGDDMIAIVSYAGVRNAATMALRYKNLAPDELDENIYVARNNLSDTYWGRGVSVVGGSNITIENNSISRTPTAAGVYLLREDSYITFGDHNVLVRNNDISETQTLPPTYKPPNIGTAYTHHGAIEVSSQMSTEEFSSARVAGALSVSGIALLNNNIHNARFAGIRLGAVSGVPNTVSNVTVDGNSVDNVGVDSVADVYSGMNRASLVCSDNKLNGTSWGSRCDSANASTNAGTSVTGSSLVCSPDGTVSSGETRPSAPSGVRISN